MVSTSQSNSVLVVHSPRQMTRSATARADRRDFPMAETRRKRMLPILFRVSDWPLATKITANAVGMCALLALVMATLGYMRGTEGLREEAQAAISADSQVVTSAVDDWN